MKLLLLSASVLLSITSATRAQGPPSTDDVKAAVTKSLPFLETEGLGWMKARKCIACHHSAFMLWSHGAAAEKGIEVDAAKTTEWARQSLDLLLSIKKELDKKKSGSVEGSHLFLGLSHSGAKMPDDAAPFLAGVLDQAQKKEGFWKYEGQPLKRPDHENNETTTMWAILALGTLEKAAPELVKNRALAEEWLKEAKPGDSNEAQAARLLLAHRQGLKDKVGEMRAALLKQQNADGGWSWTKDRPSEPFATGQTLYALGTTGAIDAAAVGKARAFLLKGQQEDGSWKSPSRKPGGGFNSIANYWGSAWATLGLTATLP